MSLSTLPPECLRQILSTIESDLDRVTLARLVQVNHYFRAVTIPFLYRRPFLCRHHFDRTILRYGPHLKLVQVLLRQLPKNTISPLLDAAYDIFPAEFSLNLEMDKVRNEDDPKTTTAIITTIKSPFTTNITSAIATTYSSPKIKYLSFIRNFILESVIFSSYGPGGGYWDHYPSKLFSYAIASKTLVAGEKNNKVATGCGEGFHDDDLAFPPDILARQLSPWALRRDLLASALRRDLTWTLCSPALEQIQRMIIPLSETDRYLNLIERFQSLIGIQFEIDELLDLYDPDGHAVELQTLTTDAQSELQQCRQKRNRQFQSMLEFVRRHLELFPSQLQTAECPQSLAFGAYRFVSETLFCPLPVQDALLDILPPPARPRTIDNFNWKRIARKIKETDLSAVEAIYPSFELAHRQLLFEGTDSNLLRRCRSLKRLELKVSPPLGFWQWAVDERVTWDRYSDIMADTTSNTASATAHHAIMVPGLSSMPLPLPLPLLPLEQFKLATQDAIRDDLNTVVFAFGETLRTINAFSSLFRGLQGLFPDPSTKELRLGQGWRLPQIKEISVTLMDTRLVIDPTLLSSGGLGDSLEKLILKDRSAAYECREIQTCEPAQEPLMHLTELVLEGWSALTLHPGTLHQTPNLENLSLGMHCNDTATFIPQVFDLHTSFFDENDIVVTPTSIQSLGRPMWSWDWQLPKLRTLSLASEFAFLFEFRMLIGCPSLETLKLNIDTEDRRLTRSITVREFTKANSPPSAGVASSSASITENECDERTEILTLPSIRNLYLFGPWVFDDATLKVMYQDVFPSLFRITEHQTRGYTLPGWFSVLKVLPKLKVAHCGLIHDWTVNNKQKALRALGLVPGEKRRTHFQRDPLFNRNEDMEPYEPQLFYFGRVDEPWSFSPGKVFWPCSLQ
ncbi:hypothetical protein BGZ83_000595 [Gryganskiella cystojenkinii]|nr:hypothetical protein BGZ83_000595 [Gryganskiella cystojenkinii]